MTNNEKLITRFAPSPTGFLHIGGARTALFNYFYTKQNHGKIILRIEDTDQERNKEEFTEGILKAFQWLELAFDAIKKQSDNFKIHKEYLQKLITEGYAYFSKEVVKKVGEREEVVRFKNPNKVVVFQDLIRGEIKTDTTDLGDFVIAKSLEEPIFHLSNVVDDILMGVNCIIRAEEHIANTPRQILIWEAIHERALPTYAHIPLILNEQKEKLSKRKHGEIVSLEYYQKNGYLKEALINYLAFLGWNPGGEREIYSLSEIIALFNIEKIQKGGAVFNVTKLNWFNKEYIKRQSKEEQLAYLKNYLPEIEKYSEALLEKLRPILIERISFYGELKTLAANGELAYYLKNPSYLTPAKIIWKKSNKVATLENLKELQSILENGQATKEDLESIWQKIFSLAERLGKGEILWPLRYALSGEDKSPDPETLLNILGLETSLERIKNALLSLESLESE